MSHKDEGLKTRHRQYWKKIEADSVVLDPGIIAISWEDSTIRLHDGYTIGGRIFPMAPAPSLTVNVLTPLSGNGSVSSPISLNIAALANQVPVLANAPITGTGIIGNPLDIDTVALAAALANAVPVAHDATLVGNGTAGAPLSVNWGLAPAPTIAHNGTLSGAGTPASPLAVVPNALASLVAVSAISPITGDGKIATPLMLDVPAMLPQLHGNVAVITDGVTITGSGTTANPLVAVPTIPVVVTAAPVTGNGTLANPIDINIVSAIAEIAAAGGVPASHDGSLFGNGTTINPLSVNWAAAPALNVQHDGTMTGQGTAGNPLAVNWSAMPQINVQHDGTMTGSGTAGSPLSVNGLALAAQVPVAVNAGLSGNGTTGSPIAINPGVLGPMLSGLVPIAVSAPLTGVGTAASPLGITNASGALRGVVQLATGAEGLQPANDSDAATPAYIDAAIAAVTIADATDTLRGKVALATAANYPQAANDIDATTPAYVAAAIAALPADKYLASVGGYNAATNIFNLNMSDGSVVPVDLTAAVADAVASVPNKHVAATIASPNGSLVVSAIGVDNQTFLFDTNATIIGIQDTAGNFTGTSIEAALAELAARPEIYLSSVGPYNAGAYNMPHNMNNGAIVNCDMGPVVTQAVALVPNKHVPATIASTNGSLSISATGTDNQTFDLHTHASIVPITDAGNHFTSTTVEGALQELAAAPGGAPVWEIFSGAGAPTGVVPLTQLARYTDTVSGERWIYNPAIGGWEVCGFHQVIEAVQGAAVVVSGSNTILTMTMPRTGYIILGAQIVHTTLVGGVLAGFAGGLVYRNNGGPVDLMMRVAGSGHVGSIIDNEQGGGARVMYVVAGATISLVSEVLGGPIGCFGGYLSAVYIN